MDNQVETTDLSKTEFSLVDTGLTDLFPDFGGVGFAGTVDGVLVFAEMNQGRCQSSPVGDTGEEDFSGLVQFLIVTFLTDIQDLLLAMPGSGRTSATFKPARKSSRSCRRSVLAKESNR